MLKRIVVRLREMMTRVQRRRQLEAEAAATVASIIEAHAAEQQAYAEAAAQLEAEAAATVAALIASAS